MALKQDHIFGSGSAALAGGAAGAAIGAAVGGPPGLAIGAAAGGAIGALVGERMSEAAMHDEDLGHFRQIFHTMPYYSDGFEWRDYAPAYRYAIDAHARHQGSPFDHVELQLQEGWEAARHFGSRLDWNRAQPAMRHAWESLDNAPPARKPGNRAEQLSKGVRALRPGGGTAMYDALYYVCRDKLGKEKQNGAVRRAIILLSDGDDNQSHVSREEAIEMAQRAEVIVYAISTNVTGSRNAGDKILQRIADATGGQAFFPFQITEVANAFSEIQDELRSQYALSYKPADFRADGRYRAIEILAQNHKGLKVRTRRGYFATAQ